MGGGEPRADSAGTSAGRPGAFSGNHDRRGDITPGMVAARSRASRLGGGNLGDLLRVLLLVHLRVASRSAGTRLLSHPDCPGRTGDAAPIGLDASPGASG